MLEGYSTKFAIQHASSSNVITVTLSVTLSLNAYSVHIRPIEYGKSRLCRSGIEDLRVCVPDSHELLVDLSIFHNSRIDPASVVQVDIIDGIPSTARSSSRHCMFIARASTAYRAAAA